jgi:hypothetical protein
MSELLLQKILVCGKRIHEIQLMAQRPFYSSFEAVPGRFLVLVGLVAE